MNLIKTVQWGPESRAASLQYTDDRNNVLPQQRHPPEQVDDVLRRLPSHGWTAGWLGRRDRALLVLSQQAQLSYANIATLTAGEVKIASGEATIKTPGGTTRLRRSTDGLLCGPCALARWVHALDLTVVYPDGRVIATVIARAVPLTSHSPHLCDSNNTITEVTARMVLLPPIDQWGHPVRTAPAKGRDPRPIHARDVARRGPATALAGPPQDREAQRADGLERRVEMLLDR